MKELVFIEGIGYCTEVTKQRYNENGISEPYTEYIPYDIPKGKQFEFKPE